MRALALIGLLLGFQDPDVDALLKQLGDESIEVREKAAAALVELGDKAEEKVKARMDSADGELKMLCRKVLDRIAVPKKLRTVLPPLRKVSLEAKDLKLREVLENLQRQTGLVMELEGLVDANVTVSVKDVLPLEALDAVCKAADAGYYIDTYWGNAKGRMVVAAPGGGFGGRSMDSGETKIRFQPGAYIGAPRQFVRHYLVEPISITLMKSDNFRQVSSSANLNLRVLWPPGVKPQAGSLSVTAVTDDKGRSLYEAPKDIGKYIRGSMPIRGSLNSNLQLAYPESDARMIASIKGTATLKYVLEEKLVTFEAPEGAAPQTKEYEGLTVELTEFKVAGGAATVKLVMTGKPRGAEPTGPTAGNNYPIRLKLEDGTTAQSGSSTMRSGGGTFNWEMTFHQVSAKVMAIEIVVDTTYHTDAFDFELKDIPLPK
jgi:hypothetical protein